MSPTPGIWQVLDGKLVNVGTGDSEPYDYEAPPPPTTYQLVYSTSSDRSAPAPLGGVTFDAPIAVFITPDADVASVTFTIDGVLERTEANAPFDLKGAVGTAANLWTPAAGDHVVGATVTRLDGTTSTISASATSAIPTGGGGGGGGGGGDITTGNYPATFPTQTALANTGPRYALTPSGGITTTQDGQVIERLDIAGQVNVRHRNVRILDCRIRSGTSSFVVNISSTTAAGQPITGIEVAYCDIEATAAGGANACIGGLNNAAQESVIGDKLHVHHCRLTGYGDGGKQADWSLWEYNYVRVRRAPGTTKHVDGFQNSGHDFVIIRNNWIDQEYSGGHNAAIFFQPYTGASNVYMHDVYVRNNIVNGGVYTIQTGTWKSNAAEPGPGPAIYDCAVYDNVFYRDYLYGVFAPRGGLNNALTPAGAVYGGVWFDNGQQVPTFQIA